MRKRLTEKEDILNITFAKDGEIISEGGTLTERELDKDEEFLEENIVFENDVIIELEDLDEDGNVINKDDKSNTDTNVNNIDNTDTELIDETDNVDDNLIDDTEDDDLIDDEDDELIDDEEEEDDE